MAAVNFKILDPSLHAIAAIAKGALVSRYNLRKPDIEAPIHPTVGWRPTLLWKRSNEYLALEVADRPFPTMLALHYSDITRSGLPIRTVVAYPENHQLSVSEFQKEVAKARELGIGLIGVDEANNSFDFSYNGISALLTIPKLDTSQLTPMIRPRVIDAYDMYMNGNPKHGVQELGQLMEGCMKSLAAQAQAKKKLTKSRFKKGTFYNLTKLIDELINEKVIDLGILGTCRGFVYPRNDTSHPQDLAAIKKMEKKYKDNFLTGVTILEELPLRFKEKGYKFKI